MVHISCQRSTEKELSWTAYSSLHELDRFLPRSLSQEMHDMPLERSTGQRVLVVLFLKIMRCPSLHGLSRSGSTRRIAG